MHFKMGKEKGELSLKGIKKIGYVSIGILLSMVLLLTSVELVAFHMDHYRASFEKYKITEATGMNMENLEHTMGDVLKYFKDDRVELDTRAVIHGEEQPVFGEREISHMVDVKALFVQGRFIRNSGVPLILIIALILIKIDKDWRKGFAKTLLYTSIANIGLLVMLLILMKIDFYKYFTYFHLIFFSNDLWILDPTTDVLIQMVPEEFFYSTAVKIIVYFVGSLLVLGTAGGYYLKKRTK